MGHCTGGPGPYTFDAFEPLVSWVEQGKAPDKIIASHITSGITTFTRPLCPYPQEAVWTGAGERTDASNWVCVKGPADFDDRFYDYWDAKFGISNRGSDHD
jgi:feruloyl esterase